jgi:xylulokinase
MGESYLLGIDIGTYSSKGVLVRADGGIVASHAIPHGMQMPHPGHFEHDADLVWWHDFVEITRSLLQKSGIDARRIAGVGTSAIGPCVLPVNEQGRPLRPGILYGIDTRASAEIAQLENVLGREEIFRRSAMHLNSQAAGPKVLWIRNHEPEIFEQARWFLTSQAYLVYKLTGLPSIDVYTAGYYLPLFDVFRREWIQESARWFVPIERLPRVYWAADVVGLVTAAAARETGLAEGTPVVAGTADAAAEALSTGMANTGDMLLMFGSSIFFILKTDRLVSTERFWSSNFLRPGEFAFAGGMSTAGSLTTWFRDQLAPLEMKAEQAGGENAYAALANAAANSPVGSNGLIALPYFEGERTPLHDPRARGMWFGLGLKHTRADMYRSILEGVAYGIRHNFEAMANESRTADGKDFNSGAGHEFRTADGLQSPWGIDLNSGAEEEGAQPQRILVSGGGAQNRLWLQIVADVCGVDLVVPDQPGGASYGDAFLASVGAGLHHDLSEIGRWVSPKEVIRFNPKNHEQYLAYYPIFRELYESTKTLMHRLTDMTTGDQHGTMDG